jgi:type VI secretion system secreted protein Hcp
MAFDIFLKLGDGSKAKGESTDTKHAGEIELIGFDYTISNPTTVGSGTTGSGGGRAQFSTFNVKKRFDKASAVLLQMAASGDHFDKAQIVLRKAGGKTALEYLTYTFEQVYVSSIKTLAELQTTGQSASNHPTMDYPIEEVCFSFANIHAKYVPQKSDGTGDSPIEGGWDLTKNQPK